MLALFRHQGTTSSGRSLDNRTMRLPERVEVVMGYPREAFDDLYQQQLDAMAAARRAIGDAVAARELLEARQDQSDDLQERMSAPDIPLRLPRHRRADRPAERPRRGGRGLGGVGRLTRGNGERETAGTRC